ncbi:hypothetical protein HN662_04915 [Candidatus Woesearchaeota archaeon]|nr:hypothetical protein [Candidatus Woesearchaeota archaeon]
MSKGAGGYTGGTSRLPPGRRAPTAIANAGGYDGGRGKPQKGYANLGGQNNTNLTSRTLSQTITQHPDGAVSQTTALTETYSFEMNTSTPTEGFNAMPYGPIRTAPPQGSLQMPGQDYLSAELFSGGIYDKLNKQADEDERRRKSQAVEAQKGSQHKFQVFDPGTLVNKKTRFVDEAEELLPYLENTHLEVTGTPLPTNFSLKLCDKDELKVAYEFFKGTWQKGIQGFCINRKQGTSRVFVLKDELAKVMLTIGHEVGHLQTASLQGVEEEAKAYAFSLEWMEAIKRKNIAGLGSVLISERPAENGLHNVAFEFVLGMMRQGTNAKAVFNQLINGLKIAS